MLPIPAVEQPEPHRCFDLVPPLPLTFPPLWQEGEGEDEAQSGSHGDLEPLAPRTADGAGVKQEEDEAEGKEAEDEEEDEGEAAAPGVSYPVRLPSRPRLRRSGGDNSSGATGPGAVSAPKITKKELQRKYRLKKKEQLAEMEKQVGDPPPLFFYLVCLPSRYVFLALCSCLTVPSFKLPEFENLL
jgi:hypothetical protein